MYILPIYVVWEDTIDLYRKKKKLRYFDHTCRSGILYTQYCVYFPIMSRSVSFRPHKYRALPFPLPNLLSVHLSSHLAPVGSIVFDVPHTT